MEATKRQLEMVRFRGDAPPVPPVSDGYRLRQYEERDRASYWRLFVDVFKTRSRLDDLRSAALEDGFFVVEYAPTGDVVASAVAAEYERAGHPDPGSLQWVMTADEHTSKGLGKAVVAAATASLAGGDYDRVYLSTDDWRLPAIHVYLELGWQPLLFAPDMEDRWNDVLKNLGRDPSKLNLVVEPR